MMQREALKIVFWQLLLILGISALFFIAKGLDKSFSVFLGGSAYLLPHLIFAWGIFAYSGAFSSERFILGFFLSEFIKLVLSAILFILIVKYLPSIPAFVMMGYVLAIFSFWFVCGFQGSRRKFAATHPLTLRRVAP